jgi:pimeloyl-ACP methyl ester carboxylesterase
MHPTRARSFIVSAIVSMLVAVLLVAPPGASAKRPADTSGLRPMIFVHGGFGSGAQFESQAMRFTSNGYPADLIHVLEYDSTFGLNSMDDVLARLDELIADVQAETGSAQVDLLGHSLGTTVSHNFLASPARAANVAHYVNIDGRTGSAPPGGVPTLAIWAGRGAPGRAITGALNVTIPNQTHVEVATSSESFAEMYAFFTSREARTTDVLRDPGPIVLSGRAVFFPQNVGAEGATLEIWRVKAATGERLGQRPRATFAIDAEGAWGPFHALSGHHYEFALTREDTVVTHHLYYEPFLRSDHLIRLLTSPPNGGIGALVPVSDRNVAMVVTRNKELWGDQGTESDVLEIDGTNVLNAATSPIDDRTIGMFIHDDGLDGISDISSPIGVFIALPFLSGVDLFVPASAPPNTTVDVDLTPRGDASAVQQLNFPNFPSTTDRVTVQFNDFTQARHTAGGRQPTKSGKSGGP